MSVVGKAKMGDEKLYHHLFLPSMLTKKEQGIASAWGQWKQSALV
jgi:hypothetical protein